MDSNKDEALRCISMAKEAIAAGNRRRALKFIGIARHLNSDLQVDGLIEACVNLKSTSKTSPKNGRNANMNGVSSSRKDEISDGERDSHVCRTDRGTQPRENHQYSGPGLTILLSIIISLIVTFLIAYLPFSEPEYSLQNTGNYWVPATTQKYGFEFFVKTTDFEVKFPVGSSARENIENQVIKDYKHMLRRNCHMELLMGSRLPTPHCDKLTLISLGVA